MPGICIPSLLHKHFVSIVFNLSEDEPIIEPKLRHMMKQRGFTCERQFLCVCHKRFVTPGLEEVMFICLK